MPKKKKNGHSDSPGRVSAHSGECEGRRHGGNGAALTRAAPREHPANSGSGLATSSQSMFQSKDEIARNMQEMFSHLDPVVIYLVLSEADFRVENAMDALLELSDAAEGKTSTTPPLSGFEMAAALLDPRPPQNQTEPSKMMLEVSAESLQKISPETTHLTEEFDALIDHELQTLASLQSHAGNQLPPSSIPFCSLPLPSQSIPSSSLPSQNSLPDHQALSELDQLDLESDPKIGSLSERSSSSTPRHGGGARGGASPVNDLSFGGASCPQKRDISVDFSHLTENSDTRPSAFKAYRRPDAFMNHVDITAHSEGLHTPAMFWNVQAPEFRPHAEEPVFITPVMKARNPWRAHPFTTAQWLAHRSISQAPLKPSATVPKSWTLPPQSRLKLEGQVLVLLRGAPGSGKTTLANAMLEQNPGGVVLSTDEYFTQNGTYCYEPNLLGEAHAWNHRRAKEAFEKGFTPIIIDNTNMQCWEMKPYVALALKHKYRVLFREPDTWWKTKPRELEKRTKHGVTREKIRRMLEHQDRYVSVQNIMASEPKSTAVFGVDMDVSQTNPTQQSLPLVLSRPDLVGDFGFGKPGGHLSSSLPDVSSVGQKYSHNSARMDAAAGEIMSHSSKDSVSSQENVVGLIGTLESELLDGVDLDRELDAYIPLSENTDHNINEDPDVFEEKVLEQPVPFSESIGQRIRRVRERRRFADGVDSSQKFELDDRTVEKASQEEGAEENDSVGLKPQLQNIVGDWPSESLEKRGQRSRMSATWTSKHPDELTSSIVEDSSVPDNRLVEHSDCDSKNKTEFQKLITLLQGDDSHLSQEASLDRDEQNSGLGTEGEMVHPDCVFEWQFGRSTDPGKENSQLQNPAKGLVLEQDDYKRCTKKAGTEIETTANGGTSVETVDSEVIDKPCLTPDTALTSGGEADPNAEVSQEKRKGLSRRAGKSCRLALTFTNQSPSLACLQSGSPDVSPQLPDLMPSPQPELHLTASLCASVQSDPQDFSLLWRISQQKCFAAESDSSTRGVVILEGNPLRFIPKTNKETSSGQQQGVPYRVCHEKGSQVEESDLTQLPLKQHSLEILGHHFKHIPIETLEDLYEKCNQDMDWATNLLLDSGEQLYREDDEVAENDLSQVPKEEPCYSQVPSHFYLPEAKMESRVNVMEQSSSECSDPQSIVPGISDDCSSAVSTDAGEPGDSVGLNQSELVQASDDGDQKKHLEQQLEPDHGGTVGGPVCMSAPSNVTDTNQPGGQPRTQQDPTVSNSTESETESQQAPLQKLTSVSQREMFDQYFDEGWIEEEVKQQREEEDGETKEVDVISQSFLAQLEDTESKEEEERKERRGQGKNGPMDIKMLELKLPTELALQLTELFGPVGISPGEFSPEDCSVLMDLNLAKLLHQKWKETIQERHRQAALSYHLLQESSVHWGESEPAMIGQRDSAAQFLIGTDGCSSLSSQSGIQEGFPFMDHWNVSRPPVSLRNIMIEEQVMQDSLEKSRLSRWDLDKKDGAAVLKEKQLFTLFPTIDRHFLRDIFRDHNYSLEQTEQFLHTLLDDEPVRNVVATEAVPEHNETHRAPSKERKQKQKNAEPKVAQFQDTEDPEYEDFRTEAMLQRRRQQECFTKAAEAYRQGQKDVASFYAQQGHLHGKKMREANHRAAVQIFKRVNATLLPQNVLDLHGLHVDEALHHLQQVLADKTYEWQQGLCRPQLAVITGRGNHSQGGVARVRPAVLDYLKSQHYRYSEPKPGLILVTLH
ncbi:LOW QUALITY PROTEIN: NEDD4-binding protein 2 [Colossoma macropomum]|uniref:LOW QUALITY PROTEIN: NEDD4-binding protein 2 n=1 Tax=Colossoma macropomum TaxID=42526 RepID=UPI001864FDC6|nr:LOW QUALITY PROTEIN: NEDD4-binding protein 2 [Colossoma macropomum]